MAYAVLNSLDQTINQILYRGEEKVFTKYLSANGIQQIFMLQEKVFFLRAFLEEFKEEGSSLERRIRDAANEAEDVIEHLMHERIRSTAAGLATGIEYDFGKLNMVMLEHIRSTVAGLSTNIKYDLGELYMVMHEHIRSTAAGLATYIQYDFGKLNMVMQEHIRSTAAGFATNIKYDLFELYMVMHEHIRSTTAGLATDLGELNMVVEEMNSISKEVHLIIPRRSPTMLQPRPSMSTCIRDSSTVGLEEDLKKIKDLVIGGPSDREIIQITGMCGIGKTTLAKEVYHDELIKKKFPVRAWITVSQDYQVDNIFDDLVRSLQINVGSNKKQAELTVFQMLTYNKYLIVLDDVWNTKVWDKAKTVFDTNQLGSRIMLTTRMESVASHGHLHKMQLMGRTQSWELLKQKVFQSQECPSELEKIGKDIATGCEGLPLAILVAARILSQRNQTQSSWEDVAQNIRSLIQNDEHFKKTMSLSYIHLPRRLRPYFIYMCGFPEAYEIRVSMLIKLWMAEGFVKDQEEAVKDWIELERQNLMLVAAIKSNGKIKSCTVHGLLRDMCNIKALDENYERRISNSHLDLREVARAYASTLRTIISFHPHESSLRGLRKFKLLRVLDVVDTDAYSLPASVFDLFNLRYLAFGCPMEVPSAISRLQNLRYLIIRPSTGSRKYIYNARDEVYLPLEIWMMPLLTHLVSSYDLFPNPEEAASALEELLTLSVVKKLICTEEMMKMICNVKKLSITYFGDRYQEDYQLHNLVLLTKLEKLTLVVKKGSLHQVTAKPIFPETLKKLTLSGWQFPWEDMKAIAALPHLQVLKLRDHAFQGRTWSTIEEGDEESDGNKDEEDEVYLFVKLEYLLIEESDLEKWVTDDLHFPALKRLVLKSCGKLNQIPNAIGYKDRLEIIEVDRANLSLLKCVREIQMKRNKNFRHLEV